MKAGGQLSVSVAIQLKPKAVLQREVVIRSKVHLSGTCPKVTRWDSVLGPSPQKARPIFALKGHTQLVVNTDAILIGGSRASHPAEMEESRSTFVVRFTILGFALVPPGNLGRTGGKLVGIPGLKNGPDCAEFIPAERHLNSRWINPRHREHSRQS